MFSTCNFDATQIDDIKSDLKITRSKWLASAGTMLKFQFYPRSWDKSEQLRSKFWKFALIGARKFGKYIDNTKK